MLSKISTVQGQKRVSKRGELWYGFYNQFAR